MARCCRDQRIAPNGAENRRARDVVWAAASAVDNIHEISGRVAEKETTKPPALLDGAVNHLRPGGANGNLGGLKIVHANGDDRQLCARSSCRRGVQFDFLSSISAQKGDPTHVKGQVELENLLIKLRQRHGVRRSEISN